MKLSEMAATHKSLATPEQIEQGIRFFDRKKDFGKSTSFCVVFDDLPLLDFPMQPCHANMMGRANSPDVSRALIATENASVRLYSPGEREDLHSRYLQWFTKESHYAPFFLSTDDFHREHGFIISSDIPTEIVQSMLLFSRAFFECGKKGFEIFNELYDKYGGDVATNLVLGSNLSHWNHNKSWYTYRDRYCKGDDIVVNFRSFHNAHYLADTKKTWDNWLSGTTVGFPKKDTYRTRACIYNSCKMFGQSGYMGDSFLSEFVKSQKEILQDIKRVRKEPIDVVVNPFARPNPVAAFEPSNTSYRWSEIRDIILPAMQSEGYFNVN